MTIEESIPADTASQIAGESSGEITPENPSEAEISPEDQYVDKMRKLSFRERQAREREINYKKRIEELEEESKQFSSYKGANEEFGQNVKKNPRILFDKYGLSVDDVLQAELDHDTEKTDNDIHPEYSKLKKEFQEYRDAQEKKELLEKEQLEKQEEEKLQAKVNEYYGSLEKEVIEGEYPHIQASNNFSLVKEVAEIMATNQKKVPDIKDVAERVEKHLSKIYEEKFGARQQDLSKKSIHDSEPMAGYESFKHTTLSDALAGSGSKSRNVVPEHKKNTLDNRSDEEIFASRLRFK